MQCAAGIFGRELSDTWNKSMRRTYGYHLICHPDKRTEEESVLLIRDRMILPYIHFCQ